MVAYSLDTMGRLTEMQNLTTRASSGGGNSTAEVAMHPNGKWLYGSNRGDDDIVEYSIGADGRMTLVGHTKTGGGNPRHFSIDPSGQYIFAANQDSNNVVVFRLATTDGKPTQVGSPTTVAGSQPTFVGAVLLP
jgi:6-phosphogluconolactonase